jgi:Ca-activated chloride channel homolog
VAEFGMLLRDSEFKGSSSFESVLSYARGAQGSDAEGYRAEFIKMVKQAEALKTGVANNYQNEE